jgi:hypothetical protein
MEPAPVGDSLRSLDELTLISLPLTDDSLLLLLSRCPELKRAGCTIRHA